MSGQSNKITKRRQRAQRILAAATELVERWGYKKTTIDDIAREAGVAKGTIYLHWKSREELFEALIANEMLILVQDLQDHLAADPMGGTLHSVITYGIAISIKRPLIKALLMGGADVLGDILHTSAGEQLVQIRLRVGRANLAILRQHGVLRTDQDINTQLKMIVAIITGFFVTNQLMLEELRFADEEVGIHLAETLHRTFESPTPPAPEALQEVTRALQQILQQFKEAIQAQQSGE